MSDGLRILVPQEQIGYVEGGGPLGMPRRALLDLDR